MQVGWCGSLSLFSQCSRETHLWGTGGRRAPEGVHRWKILRLNRWRRTSRGTGIKVTWKPLVHLPNGAERDRETNSSRKKRGVTCIGSSHAGGNGKWRSSWKFAVRRWNLFSILYLTHARHCKGLVVGKAFQMYYIVRFCQRFSICPNYALNTHTHEENVFTVIGFLVVLRKDALGLFPKKLH